MAGKVITDFIKMQLFRKGGAIANDKAVKFSADALEKRLINLGVDPNSINNQTQLKQLLAYVKQAEDQQFNQLYSGILSGDEAAKFLNKAFPKKGEIIQFPQKRSFKEEIEAMKKSGDIVDEKDMVISEKITDRDMFKDASKRFNKTDMVADSVARITSMEPVAALKEANKVIGRKGVYKNLDETQSKKILQDTEDWIFQRDISDRYDYKKNRPFRDDPDFDPDDPDYLQRMKDEDADNFATGGRAGLYTGGMVDVEPNLSDIGHGSDALMARTRLVAPNSQATTSTGLNYLLAEDNDNIRVPFSTGKLAGGIDSAIAQNKALEERIDRNKRMTDMLNKIYEDKTYGKHMTPMPVPMDDVRNLDRPSKPELQVGPYKPSEENIIDLKDNAVPFDDGTVYYKDTGEYYNDDGKQVPGPSEGAKIIPKTLEAAEGGRIGFQEGLNFDKAIEKMLEKETKEDPNLIEEGKKEIGSKILDKFMPDETELEKKEKEIFEMVKEFQKFKRENPNSRLTMSMFQDIKKKEKELFKNTVLDLAVKYPEKKIINEQGYVDKENLKDTIDQAQLDLEISPIEGLKLKRSIDTEGDQSVTSGTFDINNFSFSSPNLEEGKLTSSADFDIGKLNLSGKLDTNDSDILKSGIGLNYDNFLKANLSESDGYKEAGLNLNKTLPISDKFNLNLTGSSDMMITPDGKTYKSSDLTPKLSYGDGIFNASIAKEIMEGNNVPNLRAGIDYNNFYLKGDDLLSEDRSGIVGYQKEFGDKEGDAFFTIGGEKDLFDDKYKAGIGLKYKFADGGRTGFSDGGMGRRAFLKLLATLGGGAAAFKTGILGLGEGAGKKAVTETVKKAAGSGEVPPYFFKLVDKIKTMGDETLASQDKAIAKKYKDYVMEEDFAGNITIIKKNLDDPYPEEVIMSYKVDDVSLPSGKGMAKVDEYEEFTLRPDGDGKMKDIEPGVPDEVVNEGSVFEDNMTEFGMTKKADGGRIGFSGGNLAKFLAGKKITGSSGRFLEKIFGKEGFKEMTKRDPEMYRGLLEVVEMFRNRDKEGLKMYLQKFLPHMDDATIEDFIIGGEGTEGIRGQLIRLGSGRDYAGKLEMMKKADNIRKLDNLDVTEEMIRKPNSSGGIQTMLGE